MYCLSSAIISPLGIDEFDMLRIRFIATWVQDPGAAPQSITTHPGFKNLYLSSISNNLNALLQL